MLKVTITKKVSWKYKYDILVSKIVEDLYNLEYDFEDKINRKTTLEYLIKKYKKLGNY